MKHSSKLTAYRWGKKKKNKPPHTPRFPKSHLPKAAGKKHTLTATCASRPVATSQSPPAAGSDRRCSRGTDLFPLQKGEQKKGELSIRLIPREKQRQSGIYSQNGQSLRLQNGCKNALAVRRTGSCRVSDPSSHVTDATRWEMTSWRLPASGTCTQGHSQPLGERHTCRHETTRPNPRVHFNGTQRPNAGPFSWHLLNSGSFTGAWSRFSHCSVADTTDKPLFFF